MRDGSTMQTPDSQNPMRCTFVTIGRVQQRIRKVRAAAVVPGPHGCPDHRRRCRPISDPNLEQKTDDPAD